MDNENTNRAVNKAVAAAQRSIDEHTQSEEVQQLVDAAANGATIETSKSDSSAKDQAEKELKKQSNYGSDPEIASSIGDGSYEVKDLDFELVNNAINACLPALESEKTKAIINKFTYKPGDLIPTFLISNAMPIKQPNGLFTINIGDDINHSMKDAAQSYFDELRTSIKTIQSYLVRCDEILNEPPGETDNDQEQITSDDEEPTINSNGTLNVSSDMVGVTEDGTSVEIPAGSYEILGKKEINGETYVKIEINGKTYWVKVVDGKIVPYGGNAEDGSGSSSTDTNSGGGRSNNSHTINNDLIVIINGVPVTLKPDSYKIIATYEEGGKKYAIVEINGKYYRIEIDENGNIVPNTIAIELSGSYTVVGEDMTIEVDGQTVTIKKGRYRIIAIKTINGVSYGLVLIDGIYYWVQLDENGNIVGNSAEIAGGTYIIITTPTPIIVDGEEITITPGQYEIIDIREIDGKKYALIEVNGKYYWVPIDENGNIIPGGEALPAEPATASVDTTLTVIVNGQEVTITQGQYKIIAITTINGQRYGLIEIDGKYYWVPIDENGNIIPGGEALPANSGTYTLNQEIQFTIEGETITVTPGDYPIVRIVQLADGGYAYCIFVDGKYVWLYFDKDGNFLYSLVEIQSEGIYAIDGQLQIVDENGVVIGLTDQNNYHVYAIRYDKDGNIVAIRISPPGYPERWIVVRDGDIQNGTYTPLEDKTNNPESNVQYSGFNNKKTLLGCLIGMAAVLGAAIIYKKKKGSNEVEESYEVNDGEYPVFEEDMDDEGNVNAVRISNDNMDDEYWMEVR